MGTRTLQNYLNSLATKANATGSDVVPILDDADANALKKTGIVWLKLNSNGDLELPGKIILADKGSAPTANGEIVLHGDDMKIFSGGAVRDLTDIGVRLASALQPPAIAAATVSANTAVAFSGNGQIDAITVEDDVTLTLSDPADTIKAWRRTLIVIQDAAGDHAVTLAGNIKTSGGVAISFSVAANAADRTSWIWNGAAWVLESVTLGVA